MTSNPKTLSTPRVPSSRRNCGCAGGFGTMRACTKACLRDGVCAWTRGAVFNTFTLFLRTSVSSLAVASRKANRHPSLAAQCTRRHQYGACMCYSINCNNRKIISVVKKTPTKVANLRVCTCRRAAQPEAARRAPNESRRRRRVCAPPRARKAKGLLQRPSSTIVRCFTMCNVQ